jgi:D-alanyl-D-alanine carboxypeptidase
MFEVRVAVVLLLVVCSAAHARPLQLGSPSAIIVDASGRELFATHADEPRPIASLTKIFAALVVRARGLDLNGWTRITADDVRAARGGAGTYDRSVTMVLLGGKTRNTRSLDHAKAVRWLASSAAK